MSVLINVSFTDKDKKHTHVVDGDDGSGICRVHKQQPGRGVRKQDNLSHRYTQHVHV